MHAVQARHDVEHALTGAERQILLERRCVLEEVAPASRRAERLVRPAPRRDEASRGLRRIRALDAELLDDAPCDERVIERERALHSRAHDEHVVPVPAGGVDDGGEVQERRYEHPLAAPGGRHDRARPVRRRQDEAAVPGLEVLAR